MKKLLLVCSSVFLVAQVCAQQVKITNEPFEVSKAPSFQTVALRMPVAEPIYCVADKSVSQLQFSCADCNETNPYEFDFMTELSKKADDQTVAAGFPVIRLYQLKVTQYIHGKTLLCEGRTADVRSGPSQTYLNQPLLNPNQQPGNQYPYQQNQQQQQDPFGNRNSQNLQMNGQNNQWGGSQNQPVGGNMRAVGDDQSKTGASARISVVYMLTPRVVKSNGQGPVFSTAQGNRFFVQRQASLGLKCMVEANPPISTFKWFRDGAEIGTGPAMTVDYERYGGSSISCKGFAPELYPEGIDSDPVRVDIWDPPRILRANYDDKKNPPPGIDQSGKVTIPSTVILSCTVSGNPPPVVLWRQSAGGYPKPLNASCQEGQNYIANRALNPETNQWEIISQCSVQVNNYSFAGGYWCQSCNAVAENEYACEPPLNGGSPKSYLPFDVQGGPMMGNQPTDISQPRAEELQIKSQYCADPPPEMSAKAQQVYWEVAGQKIPANGQAVGRFRAEPSRQNSSAPDCYEVVLVVNPLEASDRHAEYVLNVQNLKGTPLRHPVKVDLGGDGPKKDVNVGLAVGLSVGLLLLIIITAIVLCWCCGWLCFANIGRRNRKPYTVYKSNVPSSLQDVKPQPVPVRSEPSPRLGEPPTTNGYGQSRAPNGVKKGPNGTPHDSLNSSGSDPFAHKMSSV